MFLGRFLSLWRISCLILCRNYRGRSCMAASYRAKTLTYICLENWCLLLQNCWQSICCVHLFTIQTLTWLLSRLLEITCRNKTRRGTLFLSGSKRCFAWPQRVMILHIWPTLGLLLICNNVFESKFSVICLLGIFIFGEGDLKVFGVLKSPEFADQGHWLDRSRTCAISYTLRHCTRNLLRFSWTDSLNFAQRNLSFIVSLFCRCKHILWGIRKILVFQLLFPSIFIHLDVFKVDKTWHDLPQFGL